MPFLSLSFNSSDHLHKNEYEHFSDFGTSLYPRSTPYLNNSNYFKPLDPPAPTLNATKSKLNHNAPPFVSGRFLNNQIPRLNSLPLCASKRPNLNTSLQPINSLHSLSPVTSLESLSTFDSFSSLQTPFHTVKRELSLCEIKITTDDDFGVWKCPETEYDLEFEAQTANGTLFWGNPEARAHAKINFWDDERNNKRNCQLPNKTPAINPHSNAFTKPAFPQLRYNSWGMALPPTTTRSHVPLVPSLKPQPKCETSPRLTFRKTFQNNIDLIQNAQDAFFLPPSCSISDKNLYAKEDFFSFPKKAASSNDIWKFGPEDESFLISNPTPSFYSFRLDNDSSRHL